MKMLRGIPSVLLLVGIAAFALASTASAFNLRVPQVPIGGASLQTYLNGADGGINVLTDQLDAQVWNTSVSGNATFTLMIEFAGNANGNALGVYNANNPLPLFQVFPGAATAGWYATAHFGGGGLVVSLFDNNSNFMGQNSYGGVNANAFGFYLSGPGGTFYSQDALNAGGSPQVITFAGTGQNFGDWWECFEDLAPAVTDHDYDDAVLLLQSVVPTPARAGSWGALKSLYR